MFTSCASCFCHSITVGGIVPGGEGLEREPLLFPVAELAETSELCCLSGGKRGDYQNCSVFNLYRVLKLCTVISTLR